jgi:hypothetical protein
MKPVFAAAICGLLFAAQPAWAQVEIFRASPGYTYFHKAGATMADHDTQMVQCLADAGRTAQPASGANALVMVNPVLGTLGMMYEAQQQQRGQAANVENCMVANRWNLMRVSQGQGTSLWGLSPDALHDRLADMVGAPTPPGELARWFGNDAANGTNNRFAIAAESQAFSLSIRAGTRDSRGLPVLPPAPDLPVRTRSALPLEPLAERDIRVTDDSALVFIRITGDIRRSADIIAFERIGPTPTTPAWAVDQRSNAFAPSLNDENIGRGRPRVGVFAYRLPPGRWRLAGMARQNVSYSFCEGTMAFEARAGEALYLGSFDLSSHQMGPDLAPRDDLVPTTRRPAGLRAAEYTPEGRFQCGGAYIYAIDPPAPAPAG